MEILTDINIRAPIETVWKILTDFPQHTAWNPFIKSLSGKLEVGAVLDLHVTPPGSKGGMKFKPRVLTLSPGREVSWKGKLLITGLFDGEHFFRLEPLGPVETRLVHGERIRGLLVPFLGSVLKNTETGFILMNNALKERAENSLN